MGVMILSNSSLPWLHGLEGLQTVGGPLQISNNAGLTNIDGLGNLNLIGTFSGVSVTISNNASLVSLQGLHSIGYLIYSVLKRRSLRTNKN